MATPPRLIPLLAQFDVALAQLVARLDGLGDAEYFWEPVPNCWSVRPRGEARGNRARGADGWVIEGASPEPEPEPFTTIAWRLCHLTSVMFLRADHTIGTKSLIYDSHDYPGTADGGIAALVAAGAAWREALTTADDATLDQVGRSSFPSGSDPPWPFLDVVWWENQELLHYRGEIALLRDLYRAGGGATIACS